MKTYNLWFLLIFLTATCSSSDANEEPIDIQVAAASSMQDSLGELEEKIENNVENVNVVFQFGGSGSLQRQIEQGAPFDIFLSASETDFIDLVEVDKIDPHRSTDLLTNTLVLIQPTETNAPIDYAQALTNNAIETIAIGTPESVPAGTFAKETLENLNVWDEVEDQIIQARSARQILTYNERNSVDAGFVFATDAASSDHVTTVEKIDADLHADIVYPIGIVQDTDHPEAASQVYDLLVNDEAKAVYEAYGFEVIGE